MNHFDRPLVAVARLIFFAIAVAFLLAVLTGSFSATIGWACAVAGLLALGLLVLSSIRYRSPHMHGSIVKAIWSVRYTASDRVGQSFQDLNTDSNEKAMTRLASGAVCNLGSMDDVLNLPFEVRTGDLVTVQRRWNPADRHWNAEAMSVVAADKMRPTKKASN